MKEHPYWKGYYATKNGSVIGRKGKPLKPIVHHTGYRAITLRQDGRQKQVRIHRFVWECLVGEIPEGLVINHIDGDKANNALDNLETITNKENTQHAYRLGLMKGESGERNSMSKLSNEQAKRLILESQEGYSNKELGDKYNLHPNYVSLIRHRKRWKKVWEELGI